MLKRLFILASLVAMATPAIAQTSFYSDRALQQVNVLTSPTPLTAAIPYGPVRVCSLPLTQQSPCLPLASITDVNGNAISNAIGGSFGQLTTDATGRYTFGCTNNVTYQVQVTQAASNTPAVNYPVTCPGGVGASVSASNVFSATQTFTSSINCTIVNVVRCISPTNPQGWAGSDLGAQLNDAQNNATRGCLGPCRIDVASGSYTISTAPTLGSGVIVYFAPGTTVVSSQTITLSTNNGGIFCNGGRGDNNGTNCLIQEAANSNLATLVQVNGYADKIENMSLDCNKANNPTGLDCLTLGATAKFEIFNTSVYNAKRNNWVTNASAQDTRCTNSAFFAAGNNGVEILPGTTDFWWTACESVNNANISIHGTTSTSTIGGLHFIGGEASNSNAAGDCIFLDGTGGSINDLQIIGMNLNPCGQNGVHLINVNQFVISSMYITNPGQSANNTYDAIQVTNFGDGVVIGNSILDGGTNCTGHSCMRYGVNITSESQKNFLGPNSIRGYQTAAYNAGVLDDYLGGAPGTVNQLNNNLRLGFPGASNTFELDVTGKSATTTAVLAAGVNGDAAARFNIQAAGQETWGPGTGATDVTFSRLGVGSLGASGSLRATQEIADQGTACTNVEIALSAGWQSTGTATVTGAVGNGQTCGWIITTGTTTAANPTVTDTLTNVLPNATTVCELNIHGGTHTAVAGETFQHTTFSATAPVFTFQGTPTAGGTTYFVTRRCGP